ncbi:MAG TPA: sigma-70 family RNA polymerase sigma factor [Candidatus Hydrogenedentes bacterium]|nr:sigma-70 family RNA polymerase sigma factor [Candidatus Hydrogenedentota bacterium]HQH54197.1 sigma-70 family RNA polymerase sigma factor [Candidatus Hydrogenedentota bacterium]HQM51187.1 sigma-70 family RNA polymerase sigma factor [Candidatus Hydrogenedentota bacterium]
MSGFNSDFWEIPTSSKYLENVPSERNLWFETEQDRERRYALQDFFQSVLPAINALIEKHLTDRQRDILRLYYFKGMTQVEIAETLSLTQSTVSRHLFGTTRAGKKVGGAIAKLRKLLEKNDYQEVSCALKALEGRMKQAS